jgi:transposase
MDVHAKTIAVAVAEPDGTVRSVGSITNEPKAIRKLIEKLGSEGRELRVCYEAGPTGYVIYWQLTRMGVACEVIAPTLIPVKPGDRVKTDRRDAEKLARCYRSGDLTAVWVPDAAHEALRDLVRAREAAKKDQLKARHRLGKFLLRHGRRPDKTMKNWTGTHWAWIQTIRFDEYAQEQTLLDYRQEVEHQQARIRRLDQAIDAAILQAPATMQEVVAALQALRGVAKVTAVTIVAELGQLSRFATAPQLMAFSGIVARENSTGERIQRGPITKAGNAHLRRIIVEAAWAYRHRPAVNAAHKKRQADLPAAVVEISTKAQHRLHQRFNKLTAKGKHAGKVVTAVARELLGFVWAIGVQVEKSTPAPPARQVAA